MDFRHKLVALSTVGVIGLGSVALATPASAAVGPDASPVSVTASKIAPAASKEEKARADREKAFDDAMSVYVETEAKLVKIRESAQNKAWDKYKQDMNAAKTQRQRNTAVYNRDMAVTDAAYNFETGMGKNILTYDIAADVAFAKYDSAVGVSKKVRKARTSYRATVRKAKTVWRAEITEGNFGYKKTMVKAEYTLANALLSANTTAKKQAAYRVYADTQSNAGQARTRRYDKAEFVLADGYNKARTAYYKATGQSSRNADWHRKDLR